MNKWLQLSVLLTVLGFSKAHHFIRLVILAALGLAGLWMIHTLAQDFNHIQATSGSSSGGTKLLYKRSVDATSRTYPELNWKLILRRDPVGCARSFICQLSAENEGNLDATEKQMLELTRYSSIKKSWASQQLQKALKNGELVRSPSECMNIYKLCPFSSKTMLYLLKSFGR